MNAPLTYGDIAHSLAADFSSRAAAHDADGSFPRENFTQLHQGGLLALAASRELGGRGASLSQLGEVVGALGAGDPATALVLSMQFIQQRAMSRPDAGWPQALARRLVQEATERGALVNALRVEPELGSPARGGLPGTVARRTPEGWRLSGHKMYCTGSPALSWYTVWARTDDPEPLVGSFVVPAGLPGIRIIESWDHLGLRASGSHDIVFDNVLIPLEQTLALRPPAAWLASDPHLQAEMAVLLGSLYSGAARAARDWTRDFLQQRKPASLGAALATLPRAQEILGRIDSLLHANARLIRSLAREVDEGIAVSAIDSSLVKSVTTNHAIEAVELALTLTSNHGLSRKNPLERHLRDVLCGRVHTPQDDSVHIAAGRRALAL